MNANIAPRPPEPKTQKELEAHRRRLRAIEAARALLEIRDTFTRGCGMEATERNIDNAVQIYCALVVAEGRK
jgi:hypothetical protein